MSAQTVEINAGRAEEIVSFDPATGEEVGRVPVTSAAEVSEAVKRAREAQKAWGALSYTERARVVMRARGVVLDELEEIALLVSRETGKPVAEAVSMELKSSTGPAHAVCGSATAKTNARTPARTQP